MSESPIFRDRSKLSPRYVPNELPHREKQLEQINQIFSESFRDPEKFPLTILQIVGPAGIGKTSTVIKFSKHLEKEFALNRLNMKIAYVNLKLQGGNKYAIYRFLLEKLAPELPSQGLSAEEMLRYLLKYLRDNKIYSMIILDEIDYLIKITKESGIIYDLTRLNEFEPDLSCNIKGVIFIARSIDFYSKLDDAELSSLGRVPMEFPAYNLAQISDILSSRCKEAFNHGVIGSDIIDEVSKITGSSLVNGDIRYALDLILYGGNLAESQGSGRVLLDHIRKVNSEINPSITSEEIEELPKGQLLALMALARALRTRKKQYVELKEIRSFAAELVEQFKLKKIDIEDHLDELESKKMVEIRSLREIGLHGASLQDLEPLLQREIGRDTFNSRERNRK